MTPIVPAIEAALVERARWFVKRRRARALAAELGLARSSQADLETLETLATITAYVRGPIGTIVDVGAHKGAFAEPASRVLNAEHVICIEPYVSLHPVLQARLTGLSHRIVSCALSDRPGTALLHLHPDTSMSSLLDVERGAFGGEFDGSVDERGGQVDVTVSTLDAELEPMSSKKPFLIKLDTQGTELRILHGATRSLDKTVAVLVEHMFATPYREASRFEDLVAFMARHGFSCAAPTRVSRRASHRVSAVDLLFVASGLASGASSSG